MRMSDECKISLMPLVSVVIATYNRADAIQRAIRSVQNQTFQDWELIVVDDGSTDATVSLIKDMEPRMTLIQQKNRGFVEARNTALRATTGTYVAFLDDDDEWYPYHLELAVAFLDSHPDAAFVNFELREDFGHGRFLIHYQVEVEERYPHMADTIDSRSFDLPAGETDPYRRIYSAKKPIGAWGKPILDRAGIRRDVYVYSGDLFPHLKWGYLLAVNPLVIRRKILAELGFQNTEFRLAADYHLIADLCRRYPAHFIALPTYIKHELNSAGGQMRSSHIVTGTRALTCAIDHVRSFESHFWNPATADAEMKALRAWKHMGVARLAVELGQRDVALEYLKSARQNHPGLWQARAAAWLLRILKNPEHSRGLYLLSKKIYFALHELRKGHLSPSSFLKKAFRTLLPRRA